MSSWLRTLGDSLQRDGDRPVKPPGDLRHAASDQPPLVESVPLAIQQLAVQSSYWILPALAAKTLGFDAGTTAAFLAMSLLLVALGMVLQLSTRGVVGSGYPLPYVPNPIALPVYMGAAAAGLQLGAVGAAILLAFVAATVLVLAFPRVLRLLTTEVCGVVIFAIGLGFVPYVLRWLDRVVRSADSADGAPADPTLMVASLLPLDRSLLELVVFIGTLAILVLAGLIRWRFAPHGFIVATVAGTLAYALTIGPDPASMEALRDAPWFAVPTVTAPAFGEMNLGLLLTAFVVAMCAIADQLGDLVVIQREQDAGWTRPDLPPLRRGILATNLTSALGGLVGGMTVGSSSVGIALSIATRSFARSVILLCAGMVAVVAACPKITALFLTIPDTVIAAMSGVNYPGRSASITVAGGCVSHS